MDADGTPTYIVSATRDGRWEIRAEGAARALATFNDEDDACAYADGLARAHEGARIQLSSHHPRIAHRPPA